MHLKLTYAMVLTPHRPRIGLLLFATKVFQYIRSQRSQSLSRAATTRAMLMNNNNTRGKSKKSQKKMVVCKLQFQDSKN